jgi:hypothetical protein
LQSNRLHTKLTVLLKHRTTKRIFQTANNDQSITRLKKKNRNVHITTDDILSFAEQIASAMDYLASKNVNHLHLMI